MGFDPFSSAAEGAVTGFGNAIALVISKFKADPTTVATLAEDIQKAALTYQTTLAQVGAAQIEAVNKTMQAEAASSSWLQQDWRPIIGLVYGAMLINNYLLLPYLHSFVHMELLTVPDSVNWTIAALLGVTTAVTGVEKVFRGEGK